MSCTAHIILGKEGGRAQVTISQTTGKKIEV
jgi:hypothetical protein